MANFNLKQRIIECKIVYYGPGRGGKTTNLEYIFKAFKKHTPPISYIPVDQPHG